MTSPQRQDPDVGVVGGGPAGLVAALALRQRGLTVRVYERRGQDAEIGLDKPCGEGLMPGCVTGLKSLGVDLSQAGLPFQGIEYRDESSSARALFRQSPGLGVRRTELSKRLHRAALEAGVEVMHGESVDCRRQGARFVLESANVTITPQLIVAADGLTSKVREAVGLARNTRGSRRFGVRRHYRVPPWSDVVEVTWGRHSEAYVTPVSDDSIGVAILWTEGAMVGRPLFDSLLEHFPELAQRLRDCEGSAPRGCGPLRQGVHGVVRANVALIGDASGYVDAITGEGLSLAVAQSPQLASAAGRFVRGDNGALRDYERQQAGMRRLPERLTEATLLLSRFPRLRRRLLRSFAKDPAPFEELLGVLAGTQVRTVQLARPGLQLLGGLLKPS